MIVRIRLDVDRLGKVCRQRLTVADDPFRVGHGADAPAGPQHWYRLPEVANCTETCHLIETYVGTAPNEVLDQRAASGERDNTAILLVDRGGEK